MKNIIQVVQHLRPGGIESLALDLTSFCGGNEKTFIISLEGELGSALKAWPRLKPFSSQLIFLNKKQGSEPGLIPKLIKIFKRLDPSTVHTHHIGPLLYAGAAARIAQVKQLIHTEHDAWHLNQRKRRVLQRTIIKLLKPTLVADAANVASQMRQQLQYNQPIKVINNGIDTERFIPGNKSFAREVLLLAQNIKLIGCSARLEKVKGQAILIDALSHLPDVVHIALAGVGSNEKALRAQVQQLGLQHRVHFLGRIDNMPKFYQALDLFCLPSLNEGFPLSSLEAQSCNIPTVVTDVGAACETLCPKSGKLIPANNADIMAEVFKQMLSDTNNQKPRLFVQQHGDVRNMVSAYAAMRENAGACYV
jgi:glycosyltransferase involved in cell wall biosynthesis